MMKIAKIIILAGQSNAVGVGHTKCLPRHFSNEKIKEYYDGYPNIKINYYSHDKKGDGFAPVTVGCTERTKDTLGPEVGIAEYLTETNPGEEIFIVKCAFGGSNLYRDWQSPSNGPEYDSTAYANQVPDIISALGTGEPIRAGWCYNELIKILGESIEFLKGEGFAPSVRAFCWMQGESDADTEDHANDYIGRYDRFLSDLRSVYGEYMSDCVYIDGGISQLWPRHERINQSKCYYAATHVNCCFIDTISHGLTTQNEPVEEPDVAHYDVDCTIKLGRLFAKQIKL